MDGPGPDVTIRDLIVYVAESVVNHPEDVHVTETEEAGVTIYQLHVAPDDMGKVIGRQGRVANALRAIVKVASARHDRRTMIEIV